MLPRSMKKDKKKMVNPQMVPNVFCGIIPSSPESL
jgi:hypothetical protein